MAAIKARPRWAAMLVVGMVLLGAAAAQARAQALSPYSDFQAMTPAQLSTLMVKLTYVESVGDVASIVFGATNGALDPSLFIPYRRSGQDYTGDEMHPGTFLASTQELKAMIDSVGTLPGVTAGGVDAGGYVSFGLLNTVGGTKVFEAIVDTTNGRALFGKLTMVLSGNRAGLQAVRSFGCRTSMLPTGGPANVTSQVQITAGGLRMDRATGQYVGKVKITNASGQALASPLYLVIRTNSDAVVVETTGTTCNMGRAGDPFVVVLGSGTLPIGGNVEQTLHIRNPGGAKLATTYEAFSGVGTP